MERTEYFNHTKPSQTQLNNTEDSKIRAILYRMRSNNQFGIRTGFRVTVNSGNTTKIDIGPGDGYTGGFYPDVNVRDTGSGERISTLTDAGSGTPGYIPTATGVALADYSNGTKNYICLEYDESSSTPLAQRFYPLTSHNTIISETFSVQVYTRIQFAAFSTVELSNLILVAIVTANGAGNALTSASIDQFIQPKTHPVSSDPDTLTGVTVNSCSDETPIGTATLRYVSATNTIYFTAPGDAEGSGTAAPSSGTYTVYSNNTSYYIIIAVVFTSLPAANVTDTVEITSLYGRDIPMACAIDQEHRDMVGSGTLSTNNPHGLSLDDISGGGFDHQDLFHINGISNDADSTQLQCQIDAVNDQILINNNGGFKNSFLIDGVTYENITGVNVGSNGSVAFDIVPIPDSGDYLIYLDSSGAPQKLLVAGRDAAQPFWDSDIELIDIRNKTAGNGTITWDDTTETLTWQAPGDGAAGDEVHVAGTTFATGSNPSGYYKLFSSDTDNWIIVNITGALGAANNSTVTIDMDETDYPEDSLLKLAIVHWRDTTELLSNLRDIRRFTTSDTRPILEQEHDEDGYHTKAFRNQLRVAVESNAFIATAESGSAIYGEVKTGDVAVQGTAAGSYGGYFKASDYGVYAEADNDYGVYGSATNDYGVYGEADNVYGVYGSAPNTAVCGIAATATGIYGSAPNEGVYGIAATNSGVFGSAKNNAGVKGIADSDYGVYGSAKNDFGVYGTADEDFGVYGRGKNFGVYGSAATNSGVFGTAFGDVGVCGKAANYGGSFTAKTETGLYGEAITNTAGFFACTDAAATAANATGIVATAITGIYGEGDSIGVRGNGDVYGVIGAASTGVWGIGNGVGVYGADADTAGLFVNLGIGDNIMAEFGSGSLAFDRCSVTGTGALHAAVIVRYYDGVDTHTLAIPMCTMGAL